jgi:2-methylcitrate dehydratase PrpD
MPTGPTEVLARHALTLALDAAPAIVLDRLKTLLLDHLGCALGGSRTPLARAAVEVATSDGAAAATLVGTTHRAAPGPAAFANATAANALDYDDTGATGHPGATIIPAALAIAESRRRSGAALLEAVLAGYEVWARIAAAIQPSWERRTRVYGNGVTQTFGAAVAVGRLVGLDAVEMLSAFGLAGAFAPLPHEGKFGWDEGRLSWVKDDVAWPAEGGIRAALLAGRGFRATHTILDGERGLWVMAGSDRCDVERMTRGLGQEYAILGISLKPYPCCRWIHSTVDTVGELVAAHRIRPEEVERVTVRSIEAFRDWFHGTRPATLVDAQFSVPHAVAMTLLDRPRASWWHDANRLDPVVQALMDRVALETDPAAQAAYATRRDSARIPATVRVDTPRGGFEAARPGARGGSDEPLTRAEVEAKYRELAEPVLGPRRAAAVLALVEKLETLETVGDLTAALTPEASA